MRVVRSHSAELSSRSWRRPHSSVSRPCRACSTPMASTTILATVATASPCCFQSQHPRGARRSDPRKGEESRKPAGCTHTFRRPRARRPRPPRLAGTGHPGAVRIRQLDGDAVPGTTTGAYGHWRVLPWFTNKHPPDRTGSTAGARNGRPTVRRRQGSPGRAQRLRRAALTQGLRGFQRDLRRAPDRARRGGPRVRRGARATTFSGLSRSSCPSTRPRRPGASRSSPRFARPPKARHPGLPPWCCHRASGSPLATTR